MQSHRILAQLPTLSIAALVALLGGCEKKSEPTKPSVGTSVATQHAEHGHSHGSTTQLGEQTVGGFIVRASRDGDIKAGSDAAIDVWVTGSKEGGTANVSAVRFWIGTQDGKGSVKAKAAIEKDNWHTHAEIPNPMPAESKLWVEIESDKGEKTVVGFDLKL
jgi:hypothetical protein